MPCPNPVHVLGGILHALQMPLCATQDCCHAHVCECCWPLLRLLSRDGKSDCLGVAAHRLWCHPSCGNEMLLQRIVDCSHRCFDDLFSVRPLRGFGDILVFALLRRDDASATTSCTTRELLLQLCQFHLHFPCLCLFLQALVFLVRVRTEECSFEALWAVPASLTNELMLAPGTTEPPLAPGPGEPPAAGANVSPSIPRLIASATINSSSCIHQSKIWLAHSFLLRGSGFNTIHIWKSPSAAASKVNLFTSWHHLLKS